MGLTLRNSWRALMAFGAILAAASASWATTDSTVSQSPSFLLVPTTLDAAGGRSASASSQLTAALAQELVVGVSSSPHFIVQSGFFAYTGTTLVPVVLAAMKTPGQPGDVDLAWSGNNSPYNVFRSTDCAAVFSAVFTTTGNNAYTDGAAPTNGLTCYNVLATAPGPIAPRGSP